MFMLLSTLCHGLAFGHTGAVMDSIDVVQPPGSSRLGIETSVGYIRQQESGFFEWNCHEAVTQTDALITPRYTESSDGIILVTLGDMSQARHPEESMYRSVDSCNWMPPSGLTGQQVSDVEFNPNDASTALAITANESGPNFLFRSTDAGLTWTQASLEVHNRIFRTIQYAPGPDGSIWISAVRYDTEEAWIYHSVDGGLTWVENALEVQSAGGLDVFVDVLIADNADIDTAWVVMGPWLDDRLLQTTDGGQTFAEVYTPGGDIIDGGQDDEGGLWLVTTGNKVIYSETGEFFFRVDTAPPSLGIEVSGEHVWLATRIPSEGSALSMSSDGVSFESIDAFDMLDGPPDCIAETHSAALCDPLWAELRDSIAGTLDTADPVAEEPTASPDSAHQQGCCTGDAKRANVGLLALMILALCRRAHHPSQGLT